MLSKITMRQYKTSDKYQIIELLNINFKNQQHLNINRDIEWWEWKYEKNIFGKPIIYVAEFNKKIIGVRPFWPWKLKIRGSVYNCFQPIDSVVDKEFRGKGLFTELTKKAILENKGRIDLIFNFPNEQSIGAYLNLGWTLIGKLQWYLKVNSMLIVKACRLLKNYSGFKSIELERDDLITYEKISDLKNYSNFDQKIKTTRNKYFLSWRYLKHPKINYGSSVIEKRGKWLIYIYEINENNYGRELIIIDYFGDLELFENMLKQLCIIGRKYNVSCTLMLKKYNTPSKILLKNFYIKKKKKYLVVLPLKLELENISEQYNNWDLFLGMHDSV
jgi:GNAT superfamily N-acetyltransferase